VTKDKHEDPSVDVENQIKTPLEWLRSRIDHEYVRHQPQHKAPKKKGGK
jgi:hypothetical protein